MSLASTLFSKSPASRNNMLGSRGGEELSPHPETDVTGDNKVVTFLMGNLKAGSAPKPGEVNQEIDFEVNGMRMGSPYSGRVYVCDFPKGTVYLDAVRGVASVDMSRYMMGGRVDDKEVLKKVALGVIEAALNKTFPTTVRMFHGDKEVPLDKAADFVNNYGKEAEGNSEDSDE